MAQLASWEKKKHSVFVSRHKKSEDILLGLKSASSDKSNPVDFNWWPKTQHENSVVGRADYCIYQLEQGLYISLLAMLSRQTAGSENSMAERTLGVDKKLKRADGSDIGWWRTAEKDGAVLPT